MKSSTIVRYHKRKWMMLAALAVGTAFQVTACGDQLAMLPLRIAFSSVTLPINTLIRQFFQSLGA
jgi:putative Mn2+ efflux pump MntP